MAFFVTLAAGLAALTSPVHAAAADPTADTQIRYNDLDLATAEGQKTLWSRVAEVERVVCSGGAMTGSRIEASTTDCKASFREMTKPQIEAAIAKARK